MGDTNMLRTLWGNIKALLIVHIGEGISAMTRQMAHTWSPWPKQRNLNKHMHWWLDAKMVCKWCKASNFCLHIPLVYHTHVSICFSFPVNIFWYNSDYVLNTHYINWHENFPRDSVNNHSIDVPGWLLKWLNSITAPGSVATNPVRSCH